jgi:DNA primase catalytic core
MARVSDVELGRLKAEVSIQRLAEARGVVLKKHGADLMGLCPFHDDKKPSLVISPAKNLWHCLGACQAGGSVIDWVMKAEGVSFRHAVELLRADLPLTAPSTAVVKESSVRKLAPPVQADADDHELLAQVVGYYNQTLKQSPEALFYLSNRGLKSSEMIDHFKLGFANRTLGLRLPMKQWKSGSEIRGRLQKLGVLRTTGHEHLNGSVVIPIFDEEGHVAGMYGRKITAGLRPGTPVHLYLPGPHRGIFNWEALRISKSIILCEALIDALTFWCQGFRNVTAMYGAESPVAEHLAAFKKYGTEQVLIAFDRDGAGDLAAEKVAKQLIEAGISCYRVQFPRGMDANEYACKMQPPGKALALALRSAVYMGKGVKKEQPVVSDSWPVNEPATPAIETAAVAPALSSQPETVVDHPPLAANAEASPTTEATPEPVTAPVTILESTAPEAVPVSDVAYDQQNEDLVFHFGDRRYRVRGLAKNTSFDSLKVNLLVGRGDQFHVDTLDVYGARQRAIYVKQASVELCVAEDVIKADLGKVLLKLEQLQDQQIRAAMAPKDTAVRLTDEETSAALELLKDPRLLERILEDFRRCGVVGEETNKLVGYLAAVSRKLDDPLAVVIQSSSAAGKSSLMDAVLAFVPEEEKVKYAAMTGQSLFYMGETNLQHKILAIVEEGGASRASYALKILQSEGELSIASTGKDPETGKLVTHEYRVQGPVMIFLTTTAIEIDEELLNRCLVLTVDEEREQTRAIHQIQREAHTLEGRLARATKKDVLKVHQNAQRLLRPLMVVNPYARDLTFVDRQTRTRRDHMKYLTMIETVALLHQHQRPVKTASQHGQAIEYIEVTLADIAVANRLADQVLGRSLDELPPQTRRLLLLVDAHVTAECQKLAMERKDFRFSRREVRDATGWGNTQLKIHLGRLEDLEYLAVHRGSRGQGFVYELAYDGKGKDGTPFLSGLIELERLGYDEKKSGVLAGWSGLGAKQSGPSRAEVGGVSGGGRGEVLPGIPEGNGGNGHFQPENAHKGVAPKSSSYTDVPVVLAAAAKVN